MPIDLIHLLLTIAFIGVWILSLSIAWQRPRRA
jgi:hypothetical protein